MTLSFKSTLPFLLLAATTSVMMTGCSNMRPADQGPRYYVSAHDSTEGDNCHRAKTTTGRSAVVCLNVPEDDTDGMSK